MKKKHILFALCCSLFSGASLLAQNLDKARALYKQGEYEQAKPIFQKLLRSNSSNGNYNFWYGVCCLKTGEAEKAIAPLKIAVKRRVSSGQLYLGQAYQQSYRFEEAIESLENYLEDLKKRRKESPEAEALLEKSKADLRMLKGVEEVCIIDSFVVDKANFLVSYKISKESGKLSTYNDYFQTEGKGTVYETEIGNKIYYSEMGPNGTLNIYSKNKLGKEWSKGRPLSDVINESGNVNYPFVLSDGVTIYYASDGEGLGGYDIFVTRYNTHNDNYLQPENVGMPFNSPYNDYMYAIDEYNNLGWFASDRYQPEGKVCIYVFIPNATKQTYNYESMEPAQLIRLAKIHSLKDTWKDTNEVQAALERLKEAIYYKPQVEKKVDFTFVIDDHRTYHFLTDFRQPQAKQLFQRYQQLEKDQALLEKKLESQRNTYSRSTVAEKKNATPAILDLEKRSVQMHQELQKLAIEIRKAEITNSKK